MQFKKTLLAMMMFGAAAAQADYRVEISTALATLTEEYENDDYDEEYDKDSDYLSFEGVFYITPVSTASGPLGQAAFLSKASEVRVSIDRDSREYDDDSDIDYLDDEYDEDTNAISGRAVIPAARIILEAGLQKGETDCTDCDDDSDNDGWMLGFGGYISDRVTLVFTYRHQEEETDFTEYDDYNGAFYSFESNYEIDRYMLAYKQLIALSGEQSLVIEPFLEIFEYERKSEYRSPFDYDSYKFDGDGAALGIDVTWYITRQLGVYAGVVGVGVENDNGDGADAVSHIGISYFLNENFRIGGELISTSGEFEYDDEDDGEFEYEGGGLEFNASVRF